MHDSTDQSHWHEPKAGENAGTGTFSRPKLPYDRFMEAEGVPVYRGIGARRVQDLPMAPWKRLGGRGRPRFSRKVRPSYSRRNNPRRCSSGTSRPIFARLPVATLPAAS